MAWCGVYVAGRWRGVRKTFSQPRAWQLATKKGKEQTLPTVRQKRRGRMMFVPAIYYLPPLVLPKPLTIYTLLSLSTDPLFIPCPSFALWARNFSSLTRQASFHPISRKEMERVLSELLCGGLEGLYKCTTNSTTFQFNL